MIYTRNTGIYSTHVFCVRYGPNQSYSTKCDWERLSLSYTENVKGRTVESKQLSGVK